MARILKIEQSGFTLIELMVVMMIIGILVAMSAFGLQNARKGARDARRKSDLETIRQALESYRSDCNYYPDSIPGAGNSITGGLSPCSLGSNTYLKNIPADPITSQYYVYRAQTCNGSSTDCQEYQIWTKLEAPPSLPSYCVIPAPNCSPSSACNFCVTNP